MTNLFRGGPLRGIAAAILLAILSTAAAEAPPAGGLFDLYRQNRTEHIPNYITEDLLLLGYSLIRQRTIAELEAAQVLPRFQTVIEALAASAGSADDDAAAVANRDFLAVLQALLAGENDIPDSARAQAELKLALDANSIAASPLWGMSLDYSQLKPRGRYAATAKLSAYFRAMRYANTVLFPVTASKATGVTAELADRMLRQALLLTETLRGNQPLAAAYAELNKRLAWQFGPGEDLTVEDLATVSQQTGAGEPAALREALLEYAREHGRQPRILGGMVDKSRLEAGVAPADALTGWRLMAARYTPDSAAFQQLVYDRVGQYNGDCAECPPPFTLVVIDGKPVKGFPRALELMALLGSAHAARVLEEDRDTHYEGYEAAYREAGTLLAGADELAGEQLGLMRAWLGEEPPADGATERRLTSMLGFWTWQRYLGVLYAKQSYTLGSKSLQIPQPRPGAWLEPAEALYQALAQLVAEHRRNTPHESWDRFAEILQRCLALSRRLQQGASLSDENEHFLNDLDRRLLGLAGGPDHPIVVDVHTNPASAEVLEEGIGFARAVAHGKARGAVFSHYEFRHPLAERLDDKAWEAMLRAGNVPNSAERGGSAATITPSKSPPS